MDSEASASCDKRYIAYRLDQHSLIAAVTSIVRSLYLWRSQSAKHSALQWHSNSVCPSARLSVACRYCVQTDNHTSKLLLLLSIVRRVSLSPYWSLRRNSGQITPTRKFVTRPLRYKTLTTSHLVQQEVFRWAPTPENDTEGDLNSKEDNGLVRVEFHPTRRLDGEVVDLSPIC